MCTVKSQSSLLMTDWGVLCDKILALNEKINAMYTALIVHCTHAGTNHDILLRTQADAAGQYQKREFYQ